MVPVFLFDLPAGAATPHQFPYVLPGNGHIVYPLLSVMFAFAVAKLNLFGLSHAGDFTDPLKQDFVVCGFGCENIGHAVCFEGVDKRLLGIKAITGNDDGKFRVGFSDFPKNSFARIDLTVLFHIPVTVSDGLRKKRHHLADIGMDNDGLKDLMMIPQSLGR